MGRGSGQEVLQLGSQLIHPILPIRQAFQHVSVSPFQLFCFPEPIFLFQLTHLWRRQSKLPDGPSIPFQSRSNLRQLELFQLRPNRENIKSQPMNPLGTIWFWFIGKWLVNLYEWRFRSSKGSKQPARRCWRANPCRCSRRWPTGWASGSSSGSWKTCRSASWSPRLQAHRKLLDEKRIEREQLRRARRARLESELAAAGIKAEVRAGPSTSTASGRRCAARSSTSPSCSTCARSA